VSGVECSWALGACMWTSSGVFHHVFLQIGAVLECSEANLADLRLFPSVNALMDLERGAALEVALAASALMLGPVSCTRCLHMLA